MNFKFATGILTRLGEELISNPEHGLIELVKNAYDADAITCSIELKRTNDIGGSIVISDDGIGMSVKAIENGWFLIGGSEKSSDKLTELGRQPAGNKDLGRISALRLGTQVVLMTRPKKEPYLEHSLTIDWGDFEKVDIVEAVNFEVQTQKTQKKPGTTIIINNLSVKLGRQEIEQLARELILLADPFADSTGFHPKLIVPEFADLEQRVHNAYFDDAEYHLTAQLDEEGRAEAWILDWQGKTIFHTTHEKLSNTPYKTTSAAFDLWVFLLNHQSFSNRKASLQDVRRWLDMVGGVRIYHRGLRVRPYGDKGYDWLDMNLARARDPEERPSTNTTAGVMLLNDSKDLLIQKTDRIGFVENEAFFELKRFANDALEWMHRERMQIREQKSKRERKEAPRRTATAKATVEKIVEATLPEELRPPVRKALQQYEQAKEREVKILRNDLQLYRGMATVGITAAVFAHEAGKPISHIKRLAKYIERKGQELLREQYTRSLAKPIEHLYRSAEMISSYALLPLHLLNKDKRRSGIVDVHLVIDGLIEVFKPLLDEAQVQIESEKVKPAPFIHGSISLLEVIFNELFNKLYQCFY